jgi:hypothetical protein
MFSWLHYATYIIIGSGFENVENASELIDKFHQDYPKKLQRCAKSNFRSGGINSNGDMEVLVNSALAAVYCLWSFDPS